MKKELYQSHGDHIDAIMPREDFLKDLPEKINASKFLKKGRTEVTAEGMNRTLTDVFTLAYGDGDMKMLTLFAYSPVQQTHYVISFFPALHGKNITVKVTDVLEWDNQVEATIVCAAGNFEFAFFATDYFANKSAYRIGDTVSVEIAALGFKIEEAERSFSFEGQKATDWLAKMGRKPDYDENGNVEPVRFSTENLVAFLNTDDKCPDEAQFQSPVTDLSSESLFGIDFHKGTITIHRDDENAATVSIPIYFRKEFFPTVKNTDPLRGWIWLVGNMPD